jgi:hypothetical protein
LKRAISKHPLQYQAAKSALYDRARRGRRVLFRGHQDWEWDLISSLGRIARARRLKGAQRTVLEHNLIREFKRLCIVHEILKTENISEDGLLRIAQHHGLPTFRLDWTTSFYVALAFAFNVFGHESVAGSVVRVWSLDCDLFESGVVRIVRQLEGGAADGDKDESVLERYYSSYADAVLIESYDDSTNRRLNRQSGAFTYCQHEGKTLDEYILDEHPKQFDAETLVWYDIDGRDERDAIRDLEFMGLDPARLMADLGGVAMAVINSQLRAAVPP